MSSKEKSDLVKEWERIQVKTFTGWANMHLGKRGAKIESVLTDFKDGTKLIELLDAIAEDEFPKGWVKKPKSRIHHVENHTLALNFIKNHGVKLASIGPTELADGNPTLTLGTIWTIILRFVIAELSAEGLSAKQGLLLWCQKKTEPYDNVDVQDFTYSFQDGLAFCALIHRHRPELIDYDSLSKDNAMENLKTAFEVGEKHLDIPKLLDPEDIVNTAKPEERSIMTYVAQLYKVFSSADQAEQAGKRVSKYLNLAKALADLVSEYEKRTTTLNEAMSNKISQLGSAESGEAYDVTKGNIESLRAYKKGDKRTWIAEQSDLLTLLGNIQAKLISQNRPKYTPPDGLHPDDVEKKVQELGAAEAKYRSELNAKLRTILDNLRKQFANLANEFAELLNGFKSTLLSTTGSLEDQLAGLESGLKELESLNDNLPPIEEAEKQCRAANIEDNEFSDFEYDDLQFQHEQLLAAYGRKIQYLKNTLAAKASESKVSAEQLQELKESFDHFDTDKDSKLTKLEFKSLLSSLGVVDIDFEGGQDKKFEAIFSEVAGEDEKIDFDEFVKYMVKITADTASPEQLERSFNTIANGKDHLTVNDLKVAQIDESQIGYLTSVLPPKEGVEGGYDYPKWIKEQFKS